MYIYIYLTDHSFRLDIIEGIGDILYLWDDGGHPLRLISAQVPHRRPAGTSALRPELIFSPYVASFVGGGKNAGVSTPDAI